MRRSACSFSPSARRRRASTKCFASATTCSWSGIRRTPARACTLKVGLTLARALCIRVEQLSQSQDQDFEAITKAMLEIEKQSQLLGEVSTSAETIKSGAEKVLERVRKTRNSLERQVEILRRANRRSEDARPRARAHGSSRLCRSHARKKCGQMASLTNRPSRVSRTRLSVVVQQSERRQIGAAARRPAHRFRIRCAPRTLAARRLPAGAGQRPASRGPDRPARAFRFRPPATVPAKHPGQIGRRAAMVHLAPAVDVAGRAGTDGEVALARPVGFRCAGSGVPAGQSSRLRSARSRPRRACRSRPRTSSVPAPRRAGPTRPRPAGFQNAVPRSNVRPYVET